MTKTTFKGSEIRLATMPISATTLMAFWIPHICLLVIFTGMTVEGFKQESHVLAERTFYLAGIMATTSLIHFLIICLLCTYKVKELTNESDIEITIGDDDIEL
jgi:hypothetical protein